MWTGQELNVENGKWATSSSYDLAGRNPIDDGRTSIEELSISMNNITVVGIVIAKEEPRSFSSKKNPGTERHLLNFTLRDSPVSFINATCWGSGDYIREISVLFHIGDIVEINNPQIQSKPLDGSDERFRPSTSSAYQLSLSENHSTLKLYGGWNLDEFNQLLHIPVKPSNDYYTLEDIITNGQNLDKQHVNLLAAVKTIGQSKDIVTKTGKHTKRCEVKLFDETCMSFPLVLWENELVNLAQMWKPRDCVIFVADVKVAYDDFRKSMIATADSKTIFTVNPDTREAHALYRYSQSVELDVCDIASEFSTGGTPELSSITEVYNIEQVKSKMTGKAENGVEYGIVFAHITSLDLDGSIHNLYSSRCSKCKNRINRDSDVCTNPNCPTFVSDPMVVDDDSVIHQWDMLVSISDFTGTIQNCHLSGETAEKMLGCSISEFFHYSNQQRTNTKWKFLLEKCKLYFKIILPSFEKQRPMTRILSCELANPSEAVKYI